MTWSFPPAEIPFVPTVSGEKFPIRRIFCIGKNFADHVREMGDDPTDTPPVFFTKPADAAIVPQLTDGKVPFASATTNLHFEGEVVVALKSGGCNLSEEEATRAIYGYGTGCDLTRRDHQEAARQKGLPWDMAKGFDHSAVLSPIMPNTALRDESRLITEVNGQQRQNATIKTMIWSPIVIIKKLSILVKLQSGDIIFTGTPEGVGPLSVGDNVRVTAGNLPELTFRMYE